MMGLLAACSETPAPPAAMPVAQQKQDTTKAPPPPAPDTTTFAVNGRVLVNTTFCGGAYPSGEMLEEMKKHHPRQGVKIFVKGDSINTDSLPVLYKAVTDGWGRFAFRMRPGHYSIYIDEQGGSSKFNPSLYAPGVTVNTALYKKWWQTPQLTFTVTGDMKLRDLLFTQGCDVQTLCPAIVNPTSMRRP